MSASVKLHIVNALDQTTRLKEGLDWLLGRHHLQLANTTGTTVSFSVAVKNVAGGRTTTEPPFNQVKLELKDEPMLVDGSNDDTTTRSDEATPDPLTGYQRLLEIMLTKQVSPLRSYSLDPISLTAIKPVLDY